MNYTTTYNRANLHVVHPQLEHTLNDQKTGRKRFESSKNLESSGHSYSYGLNIGSKKPLPKDPDPIYSQSNPKLESIPDSYRNPKSKVVNYPEDLYKDQSANYAEALYKDQGENYPGPENPYRAYPEHKEEQGETLVEPEPPSNQYYDEIFKLKEELKRKEEELAIYSKTLNKTPPKIDPQDPIYSRINKAMFDKQRAEDQKKINSSTLDYQISQKHQMKLMTQQEREKEQTIRLEMLKKLKEDEALEKMNKIRKAREYREQLEVQNLVKDNLKNQEKILLKNDLPRPFEIPPPAQHEPISRSNTSANSLGYSPGGAKFTKKTPKTICYNPITGVLKDTSQFIYGSFPGQNVKDPSITYLKNQSNIPELAAHPAFQQIKYTKSHPKVVQSFPITGNFAQIQEAREDDPAVPREREQRMAEYGMLMMQNKNPAYN